MGEGATHNSGPVEQAILKRRSPRSFSGKEVPSGHLRTIFEAARWAASSYNEQPWRFLVGRKGDAVYDNIFGTLGEFNRSWAKHAPVLILSVASRKFAHNGSPNHYGLHDTGAATAYLALQAFALGLYTHSMGGYDQGKAREAFAVPEDFEMGAVTALGYAGDGSELPEHLQEMERAPRKRKPLEEIVLAEWGRSAEL